MRSLYHPRRPREPASCRLRNLNPLPEAGSLHFCRPMCHPRSGPLVMPLTLEEFVERLDERTDLPWPAAPKIDPPRAKPSLEPAGEVRVLDGLRHTGCNSSR